MTLVDSNPKPLHQSKTLWLNGLATVVALVSANSALVPPPAAPYVMGAVAIANIVLRFMTSRPIRGRVGS